MISMNLSENRVLTLPQVAAATIPPKAIAWVGGELFPRLAAYWPNSAGHFNAAIVTSVEIWCRGVLGFKPAQIVMAVDTLALDAARQFAPRPAEVRAQLLEMFPPPAVTSEQPAREREISIRAIEVQAEATIFGKYRAQLKTTDKASEAVTVEEVTAERDRLLTYYAEQGVKVTAQFKSILAG